MRRFESCRGHQRPCFRTSARRKTAGVFCVLSHLGVEVVDDEGRPRLPQDGTGDVVLVNEELLEEGLVRQASDPGSPSAVEVVAAPHEAESGVEVPFRCVPRPPVWWRGSVRRRSVLGRCVGARPGRGLRGWRLRRRPGPAVCVRVRALGHDAGRRRSQVRRGIVAGRVRLGARCGWWLECGRAGGRSSSRWRQPPRRGRPGCSAAGSRCASAAGRDRRSTGRCHRAPLLG